MLDEPYCSVKADSNVCIYMCHSRSGGLRPPPQATSDFCKQQNPLNPFNPKSVGDIKSYSLDALFSGGAAVSAAPTK